MTPAQVKIKRWRDDPVLFVRECLGAEPDPWQCDILRAFTSNNRIAMKASKGCGKTTILSWLAWNFLATRPYPKIAATSITADNLSDGLWSEMAKWMHRSEFLKAAFQWTKTRIVAKESPENWFMSARTWSKGADANQQADALAGLHADYILFILDESGGIPDAVMAAAEAALSTGKEMKLVQAGNPTHLEGPLFRACTRERHLWFVREITGDPDDPMRANRISVQWARDQIDKYGKDNPFVQVNVYGKFPASSINVLLGPDEVESSMHRFVKPEEYEFSQKRLGVDVARFGDDRIVIFPRQGLVAFKPVEMRNMRNNEIAARVMSAKNKWDSEMEFIDATGGYGGGVIDFLLLQGCSPYAYQASSSPTDPSYLNKRAEVWFKMADWIKRGGSLPDNTDLKRELTAPTYSFNASGKFVLESKDQIKERLGFSPDLADALSMTFSIPDMPGKGPFDSMMRNKQKMKSEYDPFDESRF